MTVIEQPWPLKAHQHGSELSTNRNAVSAGKSRNQTANDECQQPFYPLCDLLSADSESPVIR